MFPYPMKKKHKASSLADAILLLEYMEKSKKKEEKKSKDKEPPKDKKGEWIFIPEKKKRMFSLLEVTGMMALLSPPVYFLETMIIKNAHLLLP